MLKAFEFCIPATSTIVPDGSGWLHEITQDGFRLRVERDGDRVRLITAAMTGVRASTMTKCSSAPLTCWRWMGDDLRKLPLSMRKANLARLLARRPDGIFVSPFELAPIYSARPSHDASHSSVEMRTDSSR
jgi:ATP-dependent DNA ligase